MYKLESVPENETHKILRDLEIQIDQLLSARRPDQVIINKTKKRKFTVKGFFCHYGGPQSEKKRKQKDRQRLGPSQRTKKAVGHEDYGDARCNLRRTVPKGWGNGQEELETRGNIDTIHITALLRSVRIIIIIIISCWQHGYL